MNIIRTTLAAALLPMVFLLGGPPAAQAADSACDPNVDQSLYVACLEDENAELRGDVDSLTWHLTVANSEIGALHGELAATRLSLDNAYAGAQRLLDRFNFRMAQVLVLRAKVKDLRQVIRTLT